MNKGIITLCYRKIIDATSSKAWEQLVFEDSYREFLMQFQLYNQKGQYRRFSELIHAEENAFRLHFLVSAAVTPYLTQLKGLVPDITNNLGKQCLVFENFYFELIESAVHQQSMHKIAISFYSEPLYFLEQPGNYLLLASVAKNKQEANASYITEMIALQPYLSIHSLQR